MKFRNIRLIAIFAVVPILLLIPYAAGKVTDEMKWSGIDFVVAGVLLAATGIVIEFVLRMVKKTSHRVAICAGILFLLVVVWIEIAVGLFGTPLAGS